MATLNPAIGTIVLYVHNMPASRTFYADTLEFPISREEDGYIEFAMTGIVLGLMPCDAASQLTGLRPPSVRAAPHLSLSLGEVSDVDAAYQDLVKKGVKFVRPPVTQPWGQRTTHFEDLDGNLWEVFTWIKTQ